MPISWAVAWNFIDPVSVLGTELLFPLGGQGELSGLSLCMRVGWLPLRETRNLFAFYLTQVCCCLRVSCSFLMANEMESWSIEEGRKKKILTAKVSVTREKKPRQQTHQTGASLGQTELEESDENVIHLALLKFSRSFTKSMKWICKNVIFKIQYMSVHVFVQIFHKRPSGMIISEHRAKVQRGNHEEKEEETWRMRPRRRNVWLEKITRQETGHVKKSYCSKRERISHQNEESDQQLAGPTCLGDISTLPCALLCRRHVLNVMG